MKKQKPDSYFNNGIFEIACFGRSTFMKNIMSEEENERYRNKVKEEFPKMKKEINNLIASIRERVCCCNPVKLLTFASDRFLVSMLNVKSEVQYPVEAINSSRMTEYVQSILVSSPNYYDFSKKDMTDTTAEFLTIQADIEKLYQLINLFYLSWGLKLIEDHPEWDRSTIDTAVQSQMLFLVRGQRYPIIEGEYHSHLLKIHNEEFIKLFKLSADDILDGFKKLQYALSEGKLNSCKELEKIFDEMERTENLDMVQFFNSHTTQAQDFIEKFFGVKLRDVIEVTGWTKEFVAALSYGINEDTTFFNQSDYAGWPIIDLPVQKRPFIKIGEQYLCFDYYTFVDNFYRDIQKTISRLDSDYVWSEKQNEASEVMVENVFKQILPGSVTYRNNYYKIGKSKNDYAENDLLIVYSGVMFIVEIKAGSFIYTSPLTDFEHHINSYKALIEAPDNQCKRTYDYLLSNEKVDSYDKDHNLKSTIDMTEITDIYMFSVTIDNINDFAAHAEKLSFLNLKCNAISISIDDLMIYREYFDSPLEFLHFLKQRRYATQEPKLALNDELDHLGMYIEHNCYPLIMRNFDKDTHNTFYGYREKLDEYFATLMHPELTPQKPLQSRSELFQQILIYLDNSNMKNKVELSDYILSFNADAEEKFNKNVVYILKRQADINHMIPTSSGGQNDDLRYTCFIRQPNIDGISDKEKRDYVLSTLIWNNDKDRVMLDFDFDNNNNFKNISMKTFTEKDVGDDERDYLYELGKQRAERLIGKYIIENKKKIGRNDLCPCGSGKKYKRCCGKV